MHWVVHGWTMNYDNNGINFNNLRVVMDLIEYYYEYLRENLCLSLICDEIFTHEYFPLKMRKVYAVTAP